MIIVSYQDSPRARRRGTTGYNCSSQIGRSEQVALVLDHDQFAVPLRRHEVYIAVAIKVACSHPVHFISKQMCVRMRKGPIPISFEEANPAIHIPLRDIQIAVAIKVRRHERE